MDLRLTWKIVNAVNLFSQPIYKHMSLQTKNLIHVS